jgi:hypothetical protein
MEKRHTYCFLFEVLILAGGLLTGCIHDQDNVTSDVVAPLHISSVRTSGIDTRSTTTLSSGTLGVFRLADTSSDLTALNNYLYTGTSGSWVATSGDVTATSTTKVCAYSPYKETCNDATQLPLTSWIGLSSDSPSHELLYSLPTVASSTSGGVNNTSFILNRAYTKLQFTLSGNSALTGAGKVTSFSIYNKNLPAGSTVNITGSSVSYGEITNQPTSRMTATTTTSDLLLSTNPVIDVLLPPCTLSDASTTTLDVTITVDGIQRLVKLNLAANNISGALAAGTVYPININLSPNGVVPQLESNCYIVTPQSTIYIPVSRASTGNSANFSTSDAFTCGLLWSDVSSTHVTAAPVGRYIKVVTGASEGNSVVYAMKGTDIVWSWHIWVTNYNPGLTANTGTNTATYSYNINLFMDRNLGSTSNTGDCDGMYYQWGRKDPFPPSIVTTGTISGTGYFLNTGSQATIATTITAPMTFYYNKVSGDWNSSPNDNLWNNTDGTKTIYDPCPVGWRVPACSDDTTSPWFGLSTSDPWDTIFGHYPPSGCRYGVNGCQVYLGSNGYYWTATAFGTLAYDLYFRSGIVYPNVNYDRSYGFSVRCVKN